MLVRHLKWIAIFGTLISPLLGQSWHIVDSPTYQNLARLDMVSENTGWAVSYDGLILQFDGEQWVIADSLSHVSQKYLQNKDTLNNAGANWGDFYTIRMVNGRNGWIAVNHVEDRNYRLLLFDGREWKPWPPAFPLKIRAMDFTGTNQGIAVGEGGAFGYVDQIWQVISLPVSVDFRTVKILAPNNIFVAGENGVILRKKAAWSLLDSPTSEMIRDMDFISAEEGWFVGNRGTILHYSHGNLYREATNTRENLWAIDMRSPNRGFAVGTGGLILEYDGNKWERLKSPTPADLHDIEMINSSQGWIIGGRGVILQYGKALSNVSQKRPHQFLFRDQVYLGTRHLMDLIDDVRGVTAADFNSDGHTDIYLTCAHSLNHLLLNDGNGYYRDFTIESGAGGDIESRKGKQKEESGALAADFDRDGDTDLLLAGKRGTTCLLVNNGNAVFETHYRNALAVDLNISGGVLGDFDLNGYPDVALVDEFKGLRLFYNRKYNHFEEIETRVKLPQTGIRTIAAADFNGDYLPDIAVFLQHAAPLLLLNSPEGTWQQKPDAFAGMRVSHFVNSATAADYNNDGYNDLFLSTENHRDALLLYNPAQERFTDQSQAWRIRREGRSYSSTAGDFDLDGDIDLFVTRFGADFLYLNEDCRYFREAAAEKVYSKAGYLSGYNIGSTSADIDHDGDLDLVVGNTEYWSSLLENTRDDSGFVTLQLLGVEDTREALGTKVWVWPAGNAHHPDRLIAFREQTLSSGYFSQNGPMMHIGIGEFKAVNIKVRFLNGKEYFFENISPGSGLQVEQSSSLAQMAYRSGRATLQILHIPYIASEIIKLLIFIGLIFASVRFIEKRYRWRPTHTVIYVLVMIALYGILIFALPRDSGLLYHVLPFGMVLFTLLALITVNEPIKKSGERQALLQNTLQDVSARLSNVTVIDQAMRSVGEILNIIYPFSFTAMYLYQSDGNYLLLKYTRGAPVESLERELSPRRQQIRKLAKATAPIPLAQLTDIPQFLPPSSEARAKVFPIVKDDEVLGICVAGMSPEIPDIEPRTLSMLNYLFMQLANTIHNLHILQDMREQEKLAAIGSFSSGILHNLKNPVDGLRMMIEALYHDLSPDDPRGEYILELHQGVLKLKNTLLHSFERVNHSGREWESVNIHDLICDIQVHFNAMNYPPIRLNLENAHPCIKGNFQRLKIALENVISNALDASGYDQGIEISTCLNRRDETIRINVVDHGPGIPVENMDQIFDVFYSTRGRGRGLGLTITRNIIKNHGGYIDVHSKPGAGTCFSIILPIKTSVEEKCQ